MFKETVMSVQREIVMMLIAILFSTVLIGASYVYWQSQNEDKVLAEVKYLQIKNKYSTAHERKQLIEKFGEKFNELIHKGVIGNEKRFSWVDVVESSVRNHQISYVKYKIDKQEVLMDKSLSSKYPGIDILVSKMNLNMQLLHEGDLFALMSELEYRAQGLFDIGECTIKRNKISSSAALEASGTDRNFKADCLLNWYTFRPKGA